MHTTQLGPLNVAATYDPLFQENTLLLWRADRADAASSAAPAWVIDPGHHPSPAHVLEALERHELRLASILLTHGHADHLAGIPTLRAALPDVPIIAPTDDAHMLTDADANLSAPFGTPITVPPADRTVSHGDVLTLDGLEFQVLDVRGHSPGGVAYYCAAAGLLIAGDALFAGSIGRTDFPGSNPDLLLTNIREHLLTLPDETVVYAGHGPTTTVNRERESNPYVGTGRTL